MRQADPLPGAGLVLTVLTLALLALIVYRFQHPVALDGAEQSTPLRQWPDMRIDINSASAAELSLLPGVGPNIAQNIVTERQTNGPFETIDDLQRVHLVGPLIVERLRPYAVVDDAPEVDHAE